MSDPSTGISCVAVILTLGQPASETTSLLLDYVSLPAHTGGISLGILLVLCLCLLLKYHKTLSYLDKKLNIRVFVLNNLSRHDAWSYCFFSLFPFLPKKEARNFCLSSEVYILQKQVKM